MDSKKKIAIAVGAIVVAGLVVWFFMSRSGMKAKQTEEVKRQVETKAPENLLNPADISQIAGLPCENKDRRPVAVMQPAELTTRPEAGFSSADMVYEMFSFTIAQVRLMAVYQCDIPDEIGSIRSGRHDYIPLAAGLDAVFVHWGYSAFAEALLNNEHVINNINCLNSSACGRWPQTGIMKYEDTGMVTRDGIEKAEAELGYSTTSTFVGYPHVADAPEADRPAGGHLRVAYPSPNDVEYNYDPETNSWLRIWGGVPDIDKNNKQQVAPKNVVVMVAESEQINLDRDQEYKSHGVRSPWDLIPEEHRAEINGVPGAPTMGRYNDVQIGDPWFDWVDSGEAYFYINGKQTKGTWKKDKSSIDSKMQFFDEAGVEVSFVPGQIWVEVVKPGIGIKWNPSTSSASDDNTEGGDAMMEEQ